MALTAEQIFSCDDAKVEEVDIPEWKDSVYIRVLTGEQLGEFQALSMRAQENPALYSQVTMCLVSLALCDKDGKRLIPKGKEGALAVKSGAAIKRVFDAAVELNKIDDEAVDELEKNSSAAPAIADSGSA